MLTEIWYTKGTEEPVLAYEYEYTSDGQVYKFKDNLSGKSKVYKYDTNNRLLQFVEYENDDLYHDYSSELSYNSKGELSSVSYYLNHTVAGSLSSSRLTHFYEYEANGQLEKTRIQTALTDGYETYTYDGYDRVSQKVNSFHLWSDTATEFENQINYTFSEHNGKTSSQIATYTSKVNSGTALTYTYTYDQNGNITKIVYSTGKEIRYVYDDIGQLIREDNGLKNYTYVYTYDNAGNITSKKTYSLTAEGTTPSSPTSTYEYGYASGWGDRLTSYKIGNITYGIEYDNIGNPTSYNNGSSYAFTWTGRQLTGLTKGNRVFSFTYNDEGIRTTKSLFSTVTTYYLEGTRIVGEETNGNVTLYIYDSEGLPIGMQYHGASYGADVWDIYWYEKNIFGDVVAVYNEAGIKLVEYKYDAWGNASVGYWNNGYTTTVDKNPFRYRGYYYDQDLGLYYLQTRYYDSNTGRFISSDGYVSTGQGILGYNMYAYCNNNPVMYVDYSGEFLGVLSLVGIATAALLLTITALVYDATHDKVLGNSLAEVVERTSQSDTSDVDSSGYTVYALKDSTGKVEYVGRTKNVVARKNAHKNDLNRKDLIFVPLEEGLSKQQARGLEQYYMMYYHTLNTLNKQNNQINGISLHNPNRSQYIDSGVKYLGNLVSNEILNLLGI